MAFEGARAPPAVGVKLNVTVAAELMMRSLFEIMNPRAATAPPMPPDGVIAEGRKS